MVMMMRRHVCVVLLILVLSCDEGRASGGQLISQNDLTKLIRFAPRTGWPGGNVTVRVGMDITHVTFNLQESTMKATFYLTKQWNEPRLYNLRVFPYLTANEYLEFNMNDDLVLWQPPVHFSNAIRVHSVDNNYVHIRVDQNGTVTAQEWYTSVFSCSELTDVRQEVQEGFSCSMKVSSSVHSTDVFTIRPRADPAVTFDQEAYIQEVEGHSEVSPTVNDCTRGGLSCAEMVLHFDAPQL